MTHTPGPWRTLLYGSTDDANVATRIDVTDSSRMKYNEPHFCAPIAVCRRVSAPGNFNFNPPNAEANARLIAAAPELLEALKRLVQHFYEGQHINETAQQRADAWKYAHDAIAKAEGEI